MKDVRPALRTLLLANPTVNSLVGGTRIFPMVIPQGEVNPSVVYHRITEYSNYHMTGDSGLLACRMQIDSWAQKADLSAQLDGAVYDVLSGFHGDEIDVTFQGIFMLAGREDYDGTAKMYRTSRDYELWYR